MKAHEKRISFERHFAATLDEVWDLWTTTAGIESWWGPDGFSVKVNSLDLREGGQLLYAMSATAPEQIEFMKRENMPLTTQAKIIFAAVEPKRRLVYQHLTDFIPGVAPYTVSTTVELEPTPSGVKMLLRVDQMHDAVWTQRATMGWESELGKLDRVIAAAPP